MAVNSNTYKQIREELADQQITLVAVSKTKPVEDIRELYALGHRDFGENYVQELVEKQQQLPADIRWHFIGHLQTNKVKLIVPFVQLIHGVDSLKLLKEINKEAAKAQRVVNCLLQVHISKEETKFGFSEQELDNMMYEFGGLQLHHVNISGFMGMASFTTEEKIIKSEFKVLKRLFDKYKQSQTAVLQTLSMGMSSDYKIAIGEGSTMVRVGSLLFGERIKN